MSVNERDGGLGGFDAALKWALERLARSDKLEAELDRGLERHGFSEEDRAAVLAYLREGRLVSDRKAVVAHMERRTGRMQRGKAKVRAELIARGAAEDLVDECLGAVLPEVEIDVALRLVRAKLKPPIDRARAGRFLAGRGFGVETIESALATLFPDQEGPA